MKQKHKMTSGEREEPSLNPFRLMVALAAISFLCFLLYALLEPYLPNSLTGNTQKPRVQIVPYASPTSVSVAVEASPLPPTPIPTEVIPPTEMSPFPTAMVMEGRAAITIETANYVAKIADLTGHSNEVSSVVFSSDGTFLASGSHDGTVKLWDVASRSELTTFRSSGGWVESVAFNSNGFQLAAAGQDNIVRSWNLVSGQALPDLTGPTGAVRSIAFNPRGTLLAAASDDGNVYLWDVQTGNLVKTLQGHTGFVTSIAFSPDGSLLASGGEDNTIRLWNIPDGTPLATLQGHTDNITSVAFSPNSTLLVASDSGGTAIVWDVTNRSQISTITDPSGSISDVAFDSLSRMVATSSTGIADNTVRFWNAQTGELIRQLDLGGPVDSITFSPNGTLLAVGGATYLNLWSVSSQAPAASEPTTNPTQEPEVLGVVPEKTETAADNATGCVLTSEYPEVNVRSGPGETYDITRTLTQGETVQADGWTSETKGTWWRLVDGGWVWAGVVSESDGCNQVFPVQP